MNTYQIIFSIIYFILLGSYLLVETSGNFKARCVNKIVMASMFLLLSIYEIITANPTILDYLLMISIFFSYVGDVWLLWSFKKGGISFMIGNIGYVVHNMIIMAQGRVEINFIIIWLVLFSIFYSIFIIFVKKGLLDISKMKIFAAYMMTVIGHGCTGIILFAFCPELSIRIYGLGLFFFMISDFFISFHNFYDKSIKWILRCNSFTYFLGMYLVAISLGL